MRFWISPFELTNPGLDLLEEAGFEPWKWDKGAPPGQDCLVLYDSPDQLVANSSNSPGLAIKTPEQLLEGYFKVLDWSQQADQPMLAIWRLQQLGPGGLGRWLADGAASEESEAPPAAQAPAIPPLVAAATLALIEACPQLLESYLDIELKAELFGGDADLHYRQRLRQARLQGELLLQALHAHAGRDQLEVREAELNDAREEAELTLLQLHQVQEELETLSLADRDKQQLLEAQTKELQSRSADCDELRQQLHQLQENLETISLADRDKQQLLNSQTKELKNRSADCDGLRQQLHQAQENLETLSLAHQEQQQLLEAQTKERETLSADRDGLRQQLHQVQENLEALSLANQEQQQLLATQTNELENRSADCAGLRQQLELREGERNEAREEAELTLLQLHQLQEELEHYFLENQDFARLASDAAAITGRLWIQHQVFEGVAP
jgi:hypothetical protein